MIEPLLWIFLGCALGTITGITPGLHINTISTLALFFAAGTDTNIGLMIVAMAIVHSFVDFIPSILFGAPDNESFLSVLPGHYFLLKGNALQAIQLTIAGGIFSLAASFLVLPVFFLFVSKLSSFFKEIIPWILVSSIILMVATEKHHKKISGLVILLSGLLGIIALNGQLISNPLLPLTTGFFGGSALVFSVLKKETITKQKEKKFFLKTPTAISGTVISSLAAAVISIIPSMGPSQAAFLVKQFTGKISRPEFLVILGGVGTANFLFTFFLLFLTGKTRTGAAAAIQTLFAPDNQSLFLVLITILISGGIGAIITDVIAKKAVKKIHLLGYQKLNKLVLTFLFAMTFALSGFFGLIAFITATATGALAQSFGVKRTTCMAFLMVPTILFYFQISP